MPLRRQHRVVLGVLVIAVLAVVVGASGGFARNAPDDVRVVEPGVEVDVLPFRVRLDGAEAVFELDGRPADEGRAYVVVDGSLSLDDDQSVGSGTLGDLVRADLEHTYDGFGSPSDVAEPIVEVADDGSTLLGVGPGLAYDVRLVFEIDESAVPEDMTVTLHEQFERPSSFDRVVGWYVSDQSVQVSLDVSPPPAERPVVEDPL